MSRTFSCRPIYWAVLDKLQKKSGRFFGGFKASKRSLKRAFRELKKNGYLLRQNNTLLLDYKNGKFVFMPLIDLR